MRVRGWNLLGRWIGFFYVDERRIQRYHLLHTRLVLRELCAVIIRPPPQVRWFVNHKESFLT